MAEELSIPTEIARSVDKPIAIVVDTTTVQMMYAASGGQPNPDSYTQYLLQLLRHAGCTAVEGTLRLYLAHGKLFKMKTDPHKPQDDFEYVWLPDAYVAAIASNGGEVARA